MSDLQEITYIGDSVYAGHDGYQVWVWTDNGLGPNSTRIALDPAVLARLVRYAAEMLLGDAEEIDHAHRDDSG